MQGDATYTAMLFTLWFGHLFVFLFKTKSKINNFNANMCISYMNVNNNMNNFTRSLFLNNILPLNFVYFC